MAALFITADQRAMIGQELKMIYPINLKGNVPSDRVEMLSAFYYMNDPEWKGHI